MPTSALLVGEHNQIDLLQMVLHRTVRVIQAPAEQDGQGAMVEFGILVGQLNVPFQYDWFTQLYIEKSVDFIYCSKQNAFSICEFYTNQRNIMNVPIVWIVARMIDNLRYLNHIGHR